MEMLNRLWAVISGALTLLVIVNFVMSTESFAGEFSFHPSLAISEEYTDNVFESSTYKRADLITRLMPGLALKYNAPLWDWDIAYNLDYRYYARSSRSDDTTHNLVAKGHIKLIDERFFLDLSDTYERVSIDITRDYSQEGLSANLSDRNIVYISPYYVFHPSQQVVIKTGYRYSNVWYKDPGLIDKREHSGFIDATYELSPQLSLTASYMFTHQNSVNSFDRHLPNVGVKYEYSEKSIAFASGGYALFDFDDGHDMTSVYWNAGLSHVFDPYVLTLAVGVSYPEDPSRAVTENTEYSASLSRTIERGSLGMVLAYSEYYEPNTDSVGSEKYSAGINGRYELTSLLIGNLGFSYEHIRVPYAQTYVRRLLLNTGLDYRISDTITLSLVYKLIDSYSPGIPVDNKQINRVIVEAKKTF